MKRSPGSDVVDRIEQFDRNDNQIKWGSAIRPSPKMGSVVPVELVDERLAKLETTVSTLKKDCRSLSEQLVREKKKGRRVAMGILGGAGVVLWLILFLRGG